MSTWFVVFLEWRTETKQCSLYRETPPEKKNKVALQQGVSKGQCRCDHYSQRLRRSYWVRVRAKLLTHRSNISRAGVLTQDLQFASLMHSQNWLSDSHKSPTEWKLLQFLQHPLWTLQPKVMDAVLGLRYIYTCVQLLSLYNLQCIIWCVLLIMLKKYHTFSADEPLVQLVGELLQLKNEQQNCLFFCSVLISK